MNRQTKRWLGYGSGAVIGSVVLAMFGIVWPSAILSVLAIICAIQARRSSDRLDALDRRANRRAPRFVGILLVLALVLVGVPALAVITVAVIQRRWDHVVGYIVTSSLVVAIVWWPRRSRPTQT